MASFDNATLRERIAAHLRAEILASRIAPGTVLQEVPLAESLGVSRGPIREALGALAAEGLVTLTPRRGAVVTSLTKRDFGEAYQVREALEALAVRLAVQRMSDQDLEALEEHIEAMSRSAARDDTAAFFEANAAFHEAIVVGSANRKLLSIYRRLTGQMRPYRLPSASLRGNLDESVDEHRRILDAARARNVDEAVRLAIEHVRIPQSRLEELSDTEFAARRDGQSADDAERDSDHREEAVSIPPPAPSH